MKIDFWLTSASAIARWAASRDAGALNFVAHGALDHMADSGWVKVGEAEVDESRFSLTKKGIVAAAEELDGAIKNARAEFEVRIGEMEAARANLLALTYDASVKLDGAELGDAP